MSSIFSNRWKAYTGWLGWRSHDRWMGGVWILGILLFLCGLAYPCWSMLLFVMLAPSRLHYEVTAEFTELPADDEALRTWLTDQSEFYREVKRDDKRVTILWGSCGYLSEPIRPNLRNEFERFGYKGMISYNETKEISDH